MRYTSREQAKWAVRQMIREAVRSRLGMLTEQEGDDTVASSPDDAAFDTGITPLGDTGSTRFDSGVTSDTASLTADSEPEIGGELGAYGIYSIVKSSTQGNFIVSLSPADDFSSLEIQEWGDERGLEPLESPKVISVMQGFPATLIDAPVGKVYNVYVREVYKSSKLYDVVKFDSSGKLQVFTRKSSTDGEEDVKVDKAVRDSISAGSSSQVVDDSQSVALAMGTYRKKVDGNDTVFTLTPISDFKIVIEVTKSGKLARKSEVTCGKDKETVIFRTSQYDQDEDKTRFVVSDEAVYEATSFYDILVVENFTASVSRTPDEIPGQSVARKAVEDYLRGTAASEEEEEDAVDRTSGGVTRREGERPVLPAAQDIAGSASLQKKIRDVAKAIKADFEDVEPVVSDKITLKKVADANPEPGHTWIDNSDDSRGQFGLSEWSSSHGDRYTYYALVNDLTRKPVAFVVASDPQENRHYSTGRFIGPGSKRENLRTSFCKLYRRATGEDYGDCQPVSTGGSAGSSTGTGGSGTGSGTAASSSSTDVVASSSGEAAAERAVAAANTGVGGAINIVKSGGYARRGRGDASSPGFLGIGQPAQEKLRRGRVIITKSENTDGFPDFPAGPGGTFMRRSISSPSKLPPSSLMVRFRHNVQSPSPTGYAEYLNFGPNRTVGDIEIIKLGWGPRYLRGGAFGLTLRSGSPGFTEAAQWILDHQAEFDLITDQTTIVDAVTVPARAGSGTGGTGSGSGDTRGADARGTSHVQRGGLVSEGVRRPRSLLDLYRF